RQAIRKGGLDDLSQILAVVDSSGALEYTMARARAEAAQAAKCLSGLVDSSHKTALTLLTEVAVARVS
ncbi:MAG: octaprenyl diphosphate synthase, partial [Marinobacter alexandrii]